jgi:protein TonB
MRDVYERLGLTATAEIREIRKAYARELKKIDQESDHQGFQSLREAYELALNLANGGTDHSHRPPQQATQAIQEAADSDELPEQLAKTAWAACYAAVEQAAQIDESVWKHALHQALASDALTNLDARLWFEALVIGMLANGWRRGHETLFIVADKIFGWEESPNRLRGFHRAGALLARALDEKHLLNGMPQQERGAIRAAMVRLRDPRRPTANELELYSQAAIRLNRLFPALVSVTMNSENLHRWREAKVHEPIISEPVEVSSSPSVTKVLLWLLAATIIGTILLSVIVSPPGLTPPR